MHLLERVLRVAPGTLPLSVAGQKTLRGIGKPGTEGREAVGILDRLDEAGMFPEGDVQPDDDARAADAGTNWRLDLAIRSRVVRVSIGNATYRYGKNAFPADVRNRVDETSSAGCRSISGPEDSQD